MVRHILLRTAPLALVALVGCTFLGCSQEVASPRHDGPAKLEIMQAPMLDASIMDDSHPSHGQMPVNGYTPRTGSGPTLDRRLRTTGPTGPATLPSDAQLLGIDEVLPGAYRVPESPPMKTMPQPMQLNDMAG